MIKRLLIIISLALFVWALIPLVRDVRPLDKPGELASEYIRNGAEDLGAANLVTSVIVTYRGLDTLGEVAVLFSATAGVGLVLTRRKKDKKDMIKPRKGSEIHMNGTAILFPAIILFGVYIFLHGHLTPGGGFQGGVVLATGMLLVMLSDASTKLNHTVLNLIESLSGFFYITIGVLGIIFAGGFLDNRILGLGQFGSLFSAGAIPIIYSLIGLKVGAELTGILENMKGTEEES